MSYNSDYYIDKIYKKLKYANTKIPKLDKDEFKKFINFLKKNT